MRTRIHINYTRTYSSRTTHTHTYILSLLLKLLLLTIINYVRGAHPVAFHKVYYNVFY